LCEGFDDLVDEDGDGVPGGRDMSGVPLPDSCDLCEGFDDSIDDDFDGLPDRQPDCDPCVGLSYIDAFPATAANLVDLVLIIDNSCSMGDDQAALANNFSSFINTMAGVGANWRLGVATTDAADLGDFVGANPPFNTPFITNGPSAAAEFAAQVQLGTGGSPFEIGIDAAYFVTQNGADGGPNGPFNFYRSAAVLSVIIVSDEPPDVNTATIDANTAYNYWLNLKGGDTSKVVVNVIGVPGSEYDTLVGLADNGQLFDIATTQWGTDLATIAVRSLATQIFPISRVPVPESIVVRANGVPFEGWIFSQRSNAVTFDGANRPPAGSFVTIEYVEDCEGVLDGCSDGIDNDNDGLIDYPDEPGCETPFDPNETDPLVTPVCIDGQDNDSDGLVDFPADPECISAAHRYETCTEVDDDVFGYRMCTDSGAASVCPDLSASQNSLGLGDEGTVNVPLGFSFDFYGIDYTSVFVGSNGTLNFEVPLSPPNNQCLSSPGQDRSIMVWWDDLNPAGGDVWTRTAGVAPNRRFEVQWRVPHFQGGLLDVRAVLKEGSNDIEMCYIDTLAGLGVDNGSSATAGIQGNQSVFIEANCFSGGLQQGNVIRFQHP
ncbi:MAG: vWA domain-containing protein, partial [Myxococcota bacterium]